MARLDDNPRSDLAITAWQWMDESYALLRSETEGTMAHALLRERCATLADVIEFLTGQSPGVIRSIARDRYERADT